MEETPRRMGWASNGLTVARLHSRPDKKPWSAGDILAHLRSCTDMWGGSVTAMLAQEDPTFPDVQPRQWIKQTDYPKIDFHKSLKAFPGQREELLRTMKNLSFEEWLRSAMIGRQETYGLLAGTPHSQT